MKVRRSDTRINANPERVILNFLQFGVNHSSGRRKRIITRVMSMTEVEVDKVYKEILSEFGHRHRKFEHYIENSFNKILAMEPKNPAGSNDYKAV